MKKIIGIATLIIGLALLSVQVSHPTVSARFAAVQEAVPDRAALSDSITVHAKGQGEPLIRLRDGREVVTNYVGPLGALLEQNLAHPLALAAGDFDRDGVADLIVSYGSPAGGIIALHRGNAAALASSRSVSAPFFSQAQVFALPEMPEFIGTGDFDADGYIDVVAAARGSRTLYLMSGNGQGGLGAPKGIELPGAITAMISGEVNRIDGLADVVVGIAGARGPQLLVFVGAEGALRSEPQVIALPAAANSLALGLLDRDHLIDIAVATGSRLLIAHGWEQAPGARLIPQIEALPLSFSIAAVAIGNFTGDQQTDLALLTTDGSLQILERREQTAGSRLMTRGLQGAAQWEISDTSNVLQSQLAISPQITSRLLVPARISSSPVDNLLVIDSSNNQLHVLAAEAATRKVESQAAVARRSMRLAASLSVEGQPVAVLPMRLNVDAINDLVLLRSGRTAPTVIVSQSSTSIDTTNAHVPFVVNSTLSTNDANPGDGNCADGAGNCTLRAAIQEANAHMGIDTINFNIPGAGPYVINASNLPSITEAVTIDGSTQPGFAGLPIIELNGGGTSGNSLQLPGNSTVRGLVLYNFGGDAITISEGSTDNVIENCFIGTNVLGGGCQGNALDGINITNSSGNQIRNNLISCNAGNGISISGVLSKFNVIQDNIIGTNFLGTAALGNALSGIVVANALNTSISDNLISGNGSGISIVQTLSSGNLIAGNRIGTNVTGTDRIANNSYGVFINLAPNNTIGTPGTIPSNLISGNRLDGVFIGSNAAGNLVQNNLIGTTISGLGPLANGSDGIEISNALNNTIGGQSANTRNVISGNVLHGVNINGSSSVGNTIQGNFIGTDITGVASTSLNGIPNAGNGVNITASNNLVGGTTAGAGNRIGYNRLAGVFVESGTGNGILGNFIFRNGGLGVDLAPVGPNIPATGIVGMPEMADLPANNGQAFPVFAGIRRNPDGTDTYFWRLKSAPNTTFRIEFFTNEAVGPDPSGFGEGETFVGTKQVTTDGNGAATFDFTIDSNLARMGMTATATSPNNDTSEFSENLFADLSVNKTDAPDPVPVGSSSTTPSCPPLTYTVRVTNNGPKDATQVVVTDILPSSVELDPTANLPSMGCTISGNTITCNVGNLPRGSTATLTFKVIPRAVGTINNTATVTGIAEGVTLLPGTGTDPNRTNDTDSETTTVIPTSDLALGVGVQSNVGTDVNPVLVPVLPGNGAVITGNEVIYTFTVTNRGPSQADNVTLTDKVFPGVSIVRPLDSRCAITLGNPENAGEQRTITCNLGSLLPNGTTQVQVKVVPLINGQIRNTANVTATQGDCDLSNNTVDPVITAKDQIADLAIESFTVSPQRVKAGQEVTFTATIRNNGPSPATQVVLISDLNPSSGVRLVSTIATQGSCTASGNGVTCNLGALTRGATATVTIKIIPTLGGALASLASVSGNEFDPNVANNTRSATTQVDPVADLAVQRLEAPETVTAGCNVTYTIAAINNGPSSATGVTLTTVLPAGVRFVSATPTQGSCTPSGSNVTCSFGNLAALASAAVTIVGTTSSPGSLPVSASVTGNEFDPTSANNTLARTTLAKAGEAQLKILLEGGRSALEFGPVMARLTPGMHPASSTFVIENTGCNPVTLSYSSVRRIGEQVTNGTITDPDDSAFFALSKLQAINPSDPGTPVKIGDQIRIEGGSRQRFRVTFNPVIPPFANATRGLKASQVLPDLVTSVITFTRVDTAPNDQFTVNLAGRVNTALQIIPAQTAGFAALAENSQQATAATTEVGPTRVRLISSPVVFLPRTEADGERAPLSESQTPSLWASASLLSGGLFNATNAQGDGPVRFERLPNNELLVTFSVYDANVDLKSATYRFLDANGNQIDELINIDLVAPLQQSQIVKGQVFTVAVRFAGGTNAGRIAGVNVTLFDSESSQTGSSFSVNFSPVTVSAASYIESLASDSIVAAFGSDLATTTAVATTLPLPTTLGGTRVSIIDAAGVEHQAALFFVSPQQVNYQIPPRAALGQARIRITNANGQTSTGWMQINQVAPGLFSANASGSGVAAAAVVRVTADNQQRFESAVRYDLLQNRFVAVPIDLGPENEQVFLVLFGTGIRNRASLSSVSAKVAGEPVEVLYAGEQGGFVGLDQINLRLPRSLIGRGEVDVVLTVNGRSTNPVQISIR